MLRPGIEPEPIAWKAIILPLDQRSLLEMSSLKSLHNLRGFIILPFLSTHTI